MVVCWSSVLFCRISSTRPSKQLHENEASASAALGGLNNEFLLLPLLGFREAAAGLLWVRCDEFFHSGDYDAILPLVRMITWLDPHADNVYVTGAWHLAYNFTDVSERSDRRYIAPSQPCWTKASRTTRIFPDIKFEKGWQNYDKIKDYRRAPNRRFKMAMDTKPNPRKRRLSLWRAARRRCISSPTLRERGPYSRGAGGVAGGPRAQHPRCD